jgi:galactokinase
VLDVVHHLHARPCRAEPGSAPDLPEEARRSTPDRAHGSRPDWTAIGQLFTASHLSLRDDYEVSSPELDLAVETTLATGALGARMTGGGFGGCAIALVPVGEADAVAAAVAEAFVRRGFNRPDHFLAEASEGAAKIVRYQ